MSQDLQRTLAQAPLTPYTLTAIAVCVGLNMIDGFDVLAMSFAASGVKADWHLLDRQLGALLSAGLVGMGLGSLSLGPCADRWGRRTDHSAFASAGHTRHARISNRTRLSRSIGPAGSDRGWHRWHDCKRRGHRMRVRAGSLARRRPRGVRHRLFHRRDDRRCTCCLRYPALRMAFRIRYRRHSVAASAAARLASVAGVARFFAHSAPTNRIATDQRAAPRNAATRDPSAARGRRPWLRKPSTVRFVASWRCS